MRPVAIRQPANGTTSSPGIGNSPSAVARRKSPGYPIAVITEVTKVARA